MSIKQTYSGVVVPMITPLDKNGAVDEVAVRHIVENLVSEKCMPFVAGTTGESASLSIAQRSELVRITVEQVAGRERVFAGIADNCFETSLKQAGMFRSLGVDAVVSHLPCYYPIDDEQMRAYFLKLADASPLPVVLYNIPITTNLSVPVPILDELSHHENVIGAKDSERGEERLAESLRLWSDRPDFTFHLGWAAMSSFGFQNGLDGSVPSSGNLVPHLYRGIYDAAKRGDAAEADRLQAITNEISDFYQAGYPLSRSIPLFKAMLEAFGVCERYAASPMLTLSSDECAKVRDEVVERFGQYVTISPI